jgi:SAM-dependent methyltransferase
MSDTEAPYLRHTLAGGEYVKCITSQESDRLARAAFQNLVLRIAPPGAALFDFGAGTGIDARFFAERGFTIEAYDVDPRMREFFAEYCRDLIESGRVALDSSSYREFVSHGTAGAAGRADLVISDFAPLNLIDDLRELFAKFHALTGPDGKVVASVLNPCFIGEMRFRWWWRGVPQLWRTGELFMPGPQAPHYRRRLANFSELSAPHFRLTRAFPALALHRNRHTKGVDAARRGPWAWPHLATSRYMFLLFEK